MRAAAPLLAVIGLVLCSSPAQVLGQGKKEPLVQKVKNGIDRGVNFLFRVQRADGSWELDVTNVNYPGGESALALLALLNAGVPATDPHVKMGLEFLRTVNTKKNEGKVYVRALQTMVFVDAGLPEDRKRIEDNIKWLIDARVFSADKFQGWAYDRGGRQADNSNTQYALLGLWAGKQAGVEIKTEIWEAIRDYYLKTQDPDGAWWYTPTQAPPLITMTSAGLCGILIAGMELNAGREMIQPDGSAKNCGIYEENAAAAKAMNWLAKRFTFDFPRATFYNLYGLERVGRLTGQRFIGGHDWYREGCEFLVSKQKEDGSWGSAGQLGDQFPVIGTSFSLLFLSKGRTPVLISKAVHGKWDPRPGRSPRDESDNDWNNDRNDLRHLVDFSSKALFKKLPLAWQTFDMARAASDALGGDELMEPVSDMMQSPILYITGHESPQFRFTPTEEKMLKLYVDNGGFILAEACCGRPAFDKGFKALVKKLWPDNQLKELPGDHPVWTSHFTVGPGKPFNLMGLTQGCKTVLIYSPKDLSCLWEAGPKDDARNVTAFRLGANIVAYATGMEPPRPRLTKVEVVDPREDPRKSPRGYLQVAQIEHDGDWQPAPRAMRNLLDHLRTRAGIDVSLKTESMRISNKSIVDYKFVYMHGRREFEVGDMKQLRFSLQNGGLLFADACCGHEAFDKAFRKFCGQLFPDHKLEQVRADDVLFSKDLNGEALTTTKIRLERGEAYRPVAPFLEGIKIGDRWVVLYSKYDIGCALEKHQSGDCLGYDPPSALRVAGAAVLYALRP